MKHIITSLLVFAVAGVVAGQQRPNDSQKNPAVRVQRTRRHGPPIKKASQIPPSIHSTGSSTPSIRAIPPFLPLPRRGFRPRSGDPGF